MTHSFIPGRTYETTSGEQACLTNRCCGYTVFRVDEITDHPQYPLKVFMLEDEGAGFGFEPHADMLDPRDITYINEVTDRRKEHDGPEANAGSGSGV